MIEKNFAKLLRSLEQNSEMSVQFLKQNAFFTYSWRILRFKTLEKFKFQKKIGFTYISIRYKSNLPIFNNLDYASADREMKVYNTYLA